MNDLRDELSDFARHIDVPTGSAADAMARARRRSQVTVVTRVGAAALLVGAGVVGVQRLSGPGLEGDPIDAPNGVANSGAPVTDPDGHTIPPVSVSPAATTAVPGQGEGDGRPANGWLADTPQARPAEYTDLNYSWTAYPIDSSEALALRFDPNAQYAVGTTDGDDGTNNAVYAKSDAGWEKIEEFSGLGFPPQLVGDTVYITQETATDTGLGSSPTIRAFDIPSRTWSDVPLPEQAVGTLPADATSLWASTSAYLSSTGDKLVVSIETNYGLDIPRSRQEAPSEISVATRPDGSRYVIATDFECLDQFGSVPTTMFLESADANVESPYAECEREVDPAEYGLTDADVALAETSVETLWTVSDGNWQQVTMPDDGWDQVVVNEGGIVAALYDTDSGPFAGTNVRMYAINDDSTVRPLFDGKVFADVGMLDRAPTNRPVGRAVINAGSYVVSQDLTSNEWTATDLTAMGDATGWGNFDAHPDVMIGTANGGVAGFGGIETDLPTEPLELTSGDYTIRFEPGAGGARTVTNNATGEELPYPGIATDSGQIELLNDNSGKQPREVLATFDIDWTEVPALNTQVKQAVFASPDGVRFGAIDTDALAATVDGGSNESLMLFKISENDGRLVVNGSFDDPFETSGTYVFVGTPN